MTRRPVPETLADPVTGEVVEPQTYDEHPPVPDSQALARTGLEPAYQETSVPSVGQLLNQVDVIRDAMDRAMDKGVHYGTIPGTPKPTLLKPGAEKLCKLFHLRPHYEEIGSVHRDQLIGYRYRCVLTHFPTGFEIAEGLGSCNSREKKYRGKDSWDIDNTIVKMAAKRALVAAVLVGTAASDIFTASAEKTRGDLSKILNGRAADLDNTNPRSDGLPWQDWTREEAGRRWGYTSRAECSDEELEELIGALDAEVTR
jgi:hypothetical protein